MPVKLTDKDLESLENVATKELELVEEGVYYVKENTAFRVMKVMILWIFEWSFYFLSLALFIAFVYLMFYTPASLYKHASHFYNISSTQNEEDLFNIIKLSRIALFILFFIIFITGLQFRSIKKKVQNNNNLQLIFEELKELIKRRKTKFNI